MRRAPRKLEKEVASAARRAGWLTDADIPAVSAAKALARKIDDTVAQLEDDGEGPVLAGADGRLSYDVSVLANLLDRLGLTPAGRYAHGINVEVDDNDLEDLRVVDLTARRDG